MAAVELELTGLEVLMDDLEFKLVDDQWWFFNPAGSDEVGWWHGPYATKLEMMEDRRGVSRLLNSEKWKRTMREVLGEQNA